MSGLNLSDADQELETCLMKYGSIKQNLVIDDPNSEHHRSAIMEFSAMQNLKSSLPMSIRSTWDDNVVFHVRSLGSVYTSATSSNVTEGYLENLQAIARDSGKTLQEVLQSKLQKISALMFSENESSRPEPEMEQPGYSSGMHTREPENPAKESTLAKSAYQPRCRDHVLEHTY